MFGNRLGWGISAVIVLVAALLGYKLNQLGQPTPPTGELVAAAAKPLALAEPARAMLPPAKPLGDAGDLYRKALDDYHNHADAYKDLTTTREFDIAAVEQLKGFDALVAATDLPAMDLYKSHPEQIVNYDQTVPSLDELEMLGKSAVSVAALSAYDKQYDAARKYAGAAMALGLHLYQERLTYGELSAGSELMSQASAELADIANRANDEPAKRAAAAFDAAKRAEYAQVQRTWNLLSGLADENVAAHAGDYFQLAEDKSVDPVWRTEAVRRLGRLKLFAFKRADNLRATAYVRKLADTAPPGSALREAAVRSRDISSNDNQSAR